MVISTNITALCLIFYCLLGGSRFVSVLTMLWARFNTRITPATVTVYGKEHITPGQSYVVVANHQSLFDIYAIYGYLGMDLRWVMKKELRNIPVFGYACEVMGQIIVDRKNPKAALAAIEAAKSQIKNGRSIIFFPEGTRSLDGQLQTFKAGAFKFATDMNLPILPVTIRGSRDILPSKTIRLQPGEMEVIVHPPIELTPLDPSDPDAASESPRQQLKRLMRQSRDAIDSAL